MEHPAVGREPVNTRANQREADRRAERYIAVGPSQLLLRLGQQGGALLLIFGRDGLGDQLVLLVPV